MIIHTLKSLGLLMLLLSLSGSNCHLAGWAPGDRPPNNWTPSLWVKLTSDSRKVYNHSILKTLRGESDCKPKCPQVDIWQYMYKPKDSSPVIVSKDPISSLRAHWKTEFEARLIGVTLFGSNPKYVDGLENLIKSNAALKKFNNISAETPWAYDTFTFRVYIPKRNPASNDKSLLKGELPQAFVERLLDMGVEVAFVDNQLNKVGLDSVFWRLMVAAEPMPENHRVRYMTRDADWIITGAEAFALGKWMNSDYDFTRYQLIPTCMGPMSPLTFATNGVHQGEGPFSDLKTFIEHYPYRMQYGDEELFARDIMWPVMLDKGSILTYHFVYPFSSFWSEPYHGSCGRPTQPLCKAFHEGSRCPDIQFPKWLDFDFMTLGAMDDNSKFLDKPWLFEMHLADHPEESDVATGLSDKPKNWEKLKPESASSW